MSRYDQDKTKTLEIVNNSTVHYNDGVDELITEELTAKANKVSAIEELSRKIEMCLVKQKQVHFISREIADIVKKSS